MSVRRYWEDFPVGDLAEMGRHTFTAADIVAFARDYDPQPFHVDPEAARGSFYGGLIASGWHTCGIGMRLMCEAYLNQAAAMGSPGLDSLRWLAPVRPGDTLTYRRRVLEARPSQSRPGVGLVKFLWDAVNQDGVVVMTMEGWQLFGRRPA